MTIVSIGIQARSTSKRLPGKSSALLGRKTVVGHVIACANKAAVYVNNYNSKRMLVDVNLLIPTGDPLKAEWAGKINIVEGPEQDVLSRYLLLQKQSKSDYIVRLTGDCPLIPPFLISKLITLAHVNSYKYVSNVDERVRTTCDGMDCEVFSKDMLDYADKHAKNPTDREHVTTIMRRQPVDGWAYGSVINFLDLSHFKLSVDTDEDLERVRAEYGKIDDAFNKAVKIFGRNHVHRL